jgi:hypothetical protein
LIFCFKIITIDRRKIDYFLAAHIPVFNRL